MINKGRYKFLEYNKKGKVIKRKMETVQKEMNGLTKLDKNDEVFKIKNGLYSKTVQALRGCNVCSYRLMCDSFDKNNEKGCSYRYNALIDARKQLGNVNSNLMKVAVDGNMDIEAYRAELLSKGINPMSDSQYLNAYKLRVDMAKHLSSMMQKKEVDIYHHKADDDEHIIIDSISKETTNVEQRNNENV